MLLLRVRSRCLIILHDATETLKHFPHENLMQIKVKCKLRKEILNMRFYEISLRGTFSYKTGDLMGHY